MRTPAKINLFLRVVRRREDGFHELETLFYPLKTPGDEVRLFHAKNARGVTLDTDDPALPADGHNLCVKALLAYCSAAGIPPEGFRIVLQKNIPVTAGMGGGSSDAAAVLRLMQKKFGCLTEKQLAETACRLGADVPFFLHCKPAFATGIGERLTPLTGLPAQLPLLIAAPAFPVSARWSYAHCRISGASQKNDSPARLIKALRKRDLSAASALLYNDLEPAALAKFPLLTVIRQELLRLGALRVMLSGSGPVQFALFEDFTTRDAAAGRFSLFGVRLITP